MNTPARASLPVIKRLPKYYRYLCSLQADGINSISSRELAAQMGTTASQVRQDFNCIGDVNGRQGIGYSCLLYTSPSPRDRTRSRMPSSA